MIDDRLVELEVLDSISDSAVCEAMKKMRLSRGCKNNGAFPNQVPSS
jgi:hypothetical protein